MHDLFRAEGKVPKHVSDDQGSNDKNQMNDKCSIEGTYLFSTLKQVTDDEQSNEAEIYLDDASHVSEEFKKCCINHVLPTKIPSDIPTNMPSAPCYHRRINPGFY